MNLFDLNGKVAVVTGGNGGIGLGMAAGLAQAGAAVLVVGRNEAKNQAAITQLRAAGAQAQALAIDVTEDTAGDAIVAAATSRFGRLDILVNNAGTNLRKQPQEYDVAEFRSMIDTNLTSAFVCSKAAYAAMKGRGGKIINIGSMMSIFGASFTAPYAASKGGIVQMSRAMATAWAKDDIQVNAILPGWITTDLTQGAQRDIPSLHDRVVQRTPAGRWGIPADLAGIAVFLASPASDFITGTAIPVDGGYSVQG
jgi:2-deoxy-D-gluconate 3-dehydrogenase